MNTNLTNYTKWEELINLIQIKSGISGYEIGICVKEHYGLSLNKKLPYSISEYEFNYMKYFILKNNLKSGYELATGIGISSISIGFAIGCNGGKLITVDSYLEEMIQNQPIDNTDISVSDDPLIRNKKLFNSLGLNNIHSYKAFSPACSSILDEELDFVFFDCPKDANDFIRDASILKDRMSNKFAIFVHDTHCFPNEFKRISKDIFGIEGKFIYDFQTPNGIIKQTFPLGIITNLEL